MPFNLSKSNYMIIVENKNQILKANQSRIPIADFLSFERHNSNKIFKHDIARLKDDTF